MRTDLVIEDHQKIFTTQYTAVLLIILTFVVGAFSHPAQQTKIQIPIMPEAAGTGVLPQVSGPLPAPAAAAIGTLDIHGAFNPSTNNLNIDQLQGVVGALRTHDIGIRLLIAVPDSEKTSEVAAALVARMVSTYRWLETLGIPSRAYQVEGVIAAEADAPQLLIEFVGGVTE